MLKYQDVFVSELSRFNVLPIHLSVEGGAVPKFFWVRQLLYAMRDKLESLVRSGVLSPFAHSEYAMPILPVLKKRRICQDLWRLLANRERSMCRGTVSTSSQR